MIRTLMLVIVALFVVSVGPVVAQDAALVEKGMAVYEAQRCRLCHSVADVGNKKGPLDSVGSKLKAEDMRAWITTPVEMATTAGATRKPAMKAFTDLSADDLNALVAYLLSLTGS